MRVQALVEVGTALGLRSALHPVVADTQPIASSLSDVHVDASHASARSADDEGTSRGTQSSGVLTLQLLLNGATGELRYVHCGSSSTAVNEEAHTVLLFPPM